MVIYQAGNYILKKTSVPKNRQYKVINLSKPYKNLHTHLRTEKEARDLIHFAINKKIPLNAKVDYLVSLKRILDDDEMVEEIENLIKRKEAKHVKENSAGRRIPHIGR